MKKILFYGNCQLTKLHHVFYKLYAEKNLEPHLLKQVQYIESSDYFKKPWIHEQITTADILVMQLHSGVELNPFVQIVPFLKKESHVIVVDSLYCTQFHPDLILSHKIPSFREGPFHDFNVIKSVVDDISLSSFLENDPFYDANFYSDEVIERGCKTTIDELTSRLNLRHDLIEDNQKLRQDLKISSISLVDFLKNKNNIKTTLWGDLSHPFNPVYKYITSNICKKIDVEFDETEFDKNFDKLNNELTLTRPVYSSVIRYFNFDVNSECRTYRIDEDYTKVSRTQYVRDVYEFYKQCDAELLKSEYYRFVNSHSNRIVNKWEFEYRWNSKPEIVSGDHNDEYSINLREHELLFNNENNNNNIAILIHGQTRTFIKTLVYESLFKFIQTLSDDGFNVVCFLYLNADTSYTKMDASSLVVKGICSDIESAKKYIEEKRNQNDSSSKDLINTLLSKIPAKFVVKYYNDDLYEHTKKQTESEKSYSFNTHTYQTSLTQFCTEQLLKPYEKQNGIRFGQVIVTRPDVFYEMKSLTQKNIPNSFDEYVFFKGDQLSIMPRYIFDFLYKNRDYINEYTQTLVNQYSKRSAAAGKPQHECDNSPEVKLIEHFRDAIFLKSVGFENQKYLTWYEVRIIRESDDLTYLM
jgi:hypothetical protein